MDVDLATKQAKLRIYKASFNHAMNSQKPKRETISQSTFVLCEEQVRPVHSTSQLRFTAAFPIAIRISATATRLGLLELSGLLMQLLNHKPALNGWLLAKLVWTQKLSCNGPGRLDL